MDKDLEKQRKVDLKEAKKAFRGTDLQKRFGPGSFGHHEMIDRSFISLEMWDYVARSPATVIDPELYEMADKIGHLMYEFYQTAARKDWEAEEKEWPVEGHSEPKKTKK